MQVLDVWFFFSLGYPYTLKSNIEKLGNWLRDEASVASMEQVLILGVQWNLSIRIPEHRGTSLILLSQPRRTEQLLK